MSSSSLARAPSVVEVHAVARVVFDDKQRAFVACGRLNRFVNLNLRRGREYVTAYRRVEHAFSYETCVCGFVSAAAARNKGDFVAVDFLFLNNLKLFNEFELGMRCRKTVAHIVYESFGSVHYFFHIAKPSIRQRLVAATAFFVFAAVFVCVADCVRRLDCRSDHVGRNGERHVVDGFVGNAGLFRNRFKKVVVDAVGAEVFKADGKSDGQAEVKNFVKFVSGLFSRTSWQIVPNATISPWKNFV